MQLYLESAIRNKLGVDNSLIKKTRYELVAELEEDPTTTVLIHGRNHVAYPEAFVRLLVSALSKKDGRGASVTPGQGTGLCDESMAALLAAALVQGVTCEIDGGWQSTEVTLIVARVIKNKPTRLEVHHPEIEGEMAVLLVKDSRLFAEGMEVPGCRKVDAHTYEFAGRHPRSRGRW